MLLVAAALMITTSSLSMTDVNAQRYPAHCGYSYEHRCVLPDEKEVQELLAEYPDAWVEKNKVLYKSIPEEDREDADGIIDAGPLSSNEPAPNNFPTNPQPGLPPTFESGAGLMNACRQSGFTEAQCQNNIFSDDPGGYCSTLKLAGLPCPKIQDPSFTFGNPGEALEESQNQIDNTQRAIDNCIAAGICKP